MSAIKNLGNGKQAYRTILEDGSVNIENVNLQNTPESPLYTQLTGSIGREQILVHKTSSDEGVVTGLQFGGSGSGERVEIPASGTFSGFTSAITLEALTMPTRFTSQNSIISLYDADGDNRGIRLEYYNYADEHEFRLYISPDGTAFTRYHAPAGNYGLNKKTHVAVTWEFDSSPILYIDGQPTTMSRLSGSVVSELYTPSIPLILGNDNDLSKQFYGMLEEIRMWKDVARTQEEIQENMHTSLSGNEDGLIGYWKLDEGEGVVAADSTENQNDGSIMGAEWSDLPSGSLTLYPEDEVTILETSEPTVIDTLTWGVSGLNASESACLIIDMDGQELLVTGEWDKIPQTPDNINNYHAPEWEISTFDISTNKYKFNLREQLECPNGVTIKLKNISTIEALQFWSVRVRGRVIK